jgi:hypothetical protein
MRVAWFGCKTGPSESPAKGTSDGPWAAYPHPRLPGKRRAPSCCASSMTPTTLLNPHGQSHESLKRDSRTPRSLPLALSSSSCGASRASGPSCARRKGSSRTCFSGRGGDAPLLFAPPGEEAQASWNPWAVRSCPSSGRRSRETLIRDPHPRPSLSTRRFLSSCARARSGSRRLVSRGRHG